MAKDIIDSLIEEITKDGSKRNSINNTLKENGITSFDRLDNALKSKRKSSGFDDDSDLNSSDTIAGVLELQKRRKEAERLLEVLEKIKKSGTQGVKQEDLDKLEKMGLDYKNIEESTDEIAKNLEKTRKEGNFSNTLKNTTNTIGNITSSIRNIGYAISDMLKPWEKANAAASKYAKTIGLSGSGMKALTDNTINNVVNSKIGIDFNMSTDELIAAQQNYIQGVGRSLRISDEQQVSLAAMTSVMGDKAIELSTAFENFGVDLNSVAEHSFDMFDTAAKRGVSFDKLSDNVAKNIKIAQNYTFRNGLKGLESMAAKAVALKMDMAQVAAFAERVGSVEGSIDVASKLQVLGGQFANMADPLGMLNEGLNDMEGLMDRVTKMVGGLGSFNKETGQVDVSSFNKKRVFAASQAMGISYDTLMESVNAQAKREAIKKEIGASASASALDEKMKELLMNSATFDKESGKYGVSIGGEFKTLDKLQNSDYSLLIEETQSEAQDIKDIARMLRSYTEKVQGFNKQKEAIQAKYTAGIGEGIGDIVVKLGNSNTLLTLILAAQGISAIANSVSSFRGIGRFRRAGRAVRGGRGLFGGATRETVKNAGRRHARRQARQRVLRSRVRRPVTNRVVGNVARTGYYSRGLEMLGSTAIKANEGMFNVGANMAAKGGFRGTIGNAITNQAIKNEAKMLGVNTMAKEAGKATAKESLKGLTKAELSKEVGKTLLKNGAKSAGVGMVLGLAGAGVDMLNTHLTNKGKLKDGGFGQGALTVGADALKGAGVGIMFGPWGAAIGAAVGATIGTVKAVAHASKVKRAKAVDAELSQLGVTRKGDYGARSLKLIDKALQTGEISDRMRRKLLREGDTDILKQIEAKKNETEEKEEAKKDKEAERQALINQGNAYKNSAKSRIRRANIKVDVAYFGGKAFGENVENGKESSGVLKKLGDFGLNLMIPGVGVATKAMEDTLKLTAASLEPVKKASSDIKVVAEKGENKEAEKMQQLAERRAAEEKMLAETKRIEEAKKNEEQKQQTQINNGKLDVNISGTIKIEADGKLFNLDELMQNQGFRQELAKRISNQIKQNVTQANVNDKK